MSAKAAAKPAKPSKDVIYVDVDDEITGIIDKVENSPEQVVALVLPKRASSLQSTVNMKLLARSAKAAGKNPVLITSENALMPLAGAAGLHVAKNLQSKPEIPDTPVPLKPDADEMPAEDVTDADEAGDTDMAAEEDLPDKIDYKNVAAIGVLAAAHEAEHPETIDLDDEDGGETAKTDPKAAKAPKTAKTSKVKVPDFDRFRMLMGLAILGVVGLIVFLILAIKVLPKGTITILTTSEPVSATFKLNASTATTTLDTKTGAIPAKLETIDQTGTAQATATGQQNNGTKASGSVILSAGTCSANFPSDIPAGTGVSANGVTFITQQTATFSAKNSGGHCTFQSNSVSMSAQSPGSKYNVNSDSFTVAGYSGVSGSGSASGGTDNIVTVLSQNDVETAKQKITSGADPNFVKNWEKKLTDSGEYVITATLKSADPVVISSPAVGQPASTATVNSKTTHTVLTVKKTDLTQSFQAQLANQIDPKKQKLSPSSLDDANITVAAQTSANSAILAVSVDTTAVPIIDVNNVKQVAKGKKTGDITAIINKWPGIKAVDVKLSPFWVSKVPSKESKITVVVKEVKDNSKNSGQP